MVLGDVQRMTTAGPSGAGNGNTIVDFGTGISSRGRLEWNDAPANQEPVPIRIYGKARHALRATDEAVTR